MTRTGWIESSPRRSISAKSSSTARHGWTGWPRTSRTPTARNPIPQNFNHERGYGERSWKAKSHDIPSPPPFSWRLPSYCSARSAAGTASLWRTWPRSSMRRAPSCTRRNVSPGVPARTSPSYVGEVRKYISTDIGFMEEMYDGDGHLDHRYYLLKKGRSFSYTPRARGTSGSPRRDASTTNCSRCPRPAGLVNYFTSMPYTKLGRSQFGGSSRGVRGRQHGLLLAHGLRQVPLSHPEHVRDALGGAGDISAGRDRDEDRRGSGLHERFSEDPRGVHGLRFRVGRPPARGILDPNIPADYTRINFEFGAPEISVASAGEDWTPTIAAPRLWPADEGGNNHAYQGVPAGEVISWTFADRAATLAGGYLATITSQQENDFVFGLIGDDPACWRCWRYALHGALVGRLSTGGSPGTGGRLAVGDRRTLRVRRMALRRTFRPERGSAALHGQNRIARCSLERSAGQPWVGPHELPRGI